MEEQPHSARNPTMAEFIKFFQNEQGGVSEGKVKVNDENRIAETNKGQTPEIYSQAHDLLIKFGIKRQAYEDKALPMFFYSSRMTYLITPPVIIQVGDLDVLVTISDNFWMNPVSEGQDVFFVEAHLGPHNKNILVISGTNQRTKNWSNELATPDQMKGAAELIFNIGKSLEKKRKKK